MADGRTMVSTNSLVRKQLSWHNSTMQNFPDPNATRTEIEAFVRANRPPPSTDIPHEAPLVENGPSIVCCACEVVRIGIGSPFCKGCAAMIGAMT
jgi:hypothetical protein